jgi:hypothetical protein
MIAAREMGLGSELLSEAPFAFLGHQNIREVLQVRLRAEREESQAGIVAVAEREYKKRIRQML